MGRSGRGQVATGRDAVRGTLRIQDGDPVAQRGQDRLRGRAAVATGRLSIPTVFAVIAIRVVGHDNPVTSANSAPTR
jgi:hypothetical protein